MNKISVLLPVKNGEKFLNQAIDSILNQTYTDFELLIIDDNSTDRTLEILNSYQDQRIKIILSDEGFIPNLNRGIEIADCQYIARMDADDIMNPIRLETQLQIMEDLHVDVCCSYLNVFEAGKKSFILDHGLQGLIDKPLEKLAKDNFVPHPSVMMRKEFLIKHNLRYVNYPHAEDYKLWCEIAKKDGKFYIEPTPLLSYRIGNHQVTKRFVEEQEYQTVRIQHEMNEYLKNQ